MSTMLADQTSQLAPAQVQEVLGRVSRLLKEQGQTVINDPLLMFVAHQVNLRFPNSVEIWHVAELIKDSQRQAVALSGHTALKSGDFCVFLEETPVHPWKDYLQKFGWPCQAHPMIYTPGIWTWQKWVGKLVDRASAEWEAHCIDSQLPGVPAMARVRF